MSEDAYARKEGFPTKIVMGVLAGIVVALWFIIGSGYQAVLPQERNYEPPTVWLAYKGDMHTGLRGSYCWAERCVDSPLREPLGQIDVEKGSSMSFITNSLTEPTSMNVQAYTIDDQGNMRGVGELAAGESKYSYRADLPSGIYVIDAHLAWQDMGDTTYAFTIKVG